MHHSGVRWRHRLLASWALLVLAFLYLPVALLMAYSFNDAALGVRWTGFTWRWYRSLAADDALLAALGIASSLPPAPRFLATALGPPAHGCSTAIRCRAWEGRCGP